MSEKSTALERQPHGEMSMAEREMAGLRREVEMFAGSGLVPEKFRGKPDALMAVALSIQQSEMPVTLATINQWWVDPKGVARPQVQFMIATAAVKGVELWCNDDECSDDQAVAYGRRAGGDVRKCTYTFARAQKAGLVGKDNWKHTGVMLKWRALGELVKTAFPDVALGLPSSLFDGEQVQSRAEAEAAAVEVDLDDDVTDAVILDDHQVPDAEVGAIPTASADWVGAFLERCAEIEPERAGRLAAAIVRHVTNGERSEPTTLHRGSEQSAAKAAFAEVVDGRWDLSIGDDGTASLVEAQPPAGSEA